MVNLVPLIPLLALLGSVIIASAGARLPGKGAYLAVATLAAAWLISAGILIKSLISGGHPPQWHRSVEWLVTGSAPVRMGFAVDGLALAMLLVVTTVSLLVHACSIGYMHGDPRYPRFFSFLQFLSFSMLTLVLVDNLLLLYIAWELVGVILAGVFLKMGCYGFLRIVLPALPEAAQHYAIWVAVLALISIVYGAFVAMAQMDFKKLFAYSSVNHMGYVMLGIAAACSLGPANLSDRATALNGAMLQMFSHGVITGALFLLVGVVYERTHTRDLREFRILNGFATGLASYCVGG